MTYENLDKNFVKLAEILISKVVLEIKYRMISKKFVLESAIHFP